jgi:hypothetical protein
MINDELYLSHREIKSLRRYKKLGNSELLPYSERLISNKLIEAGFVCQTPGNMPVPNDVYSITELGINHLLYRKEKIFLKKLPVVISLIALISSFRTEILLLARLSIQLLKNIMGI